MAEDDASTPRETPDTQGSDAHLRRDAIAALAVMLAVVGAVVGTRLARIFEPRPTIAQCEELVDRYVEHASKQYDPAVDAQDIALAIAASRDRPGSREADVNACAEHLTAPQVACALACHSVDEMERCLQ